MALTLEKIGLKNGPPNPDWYFNSPARPWNDGRQLIQNQILNSIKKTETATENTFDYTKDKVDTNPETNKSQNKDIFKNLSSIANKIQLLNPLKETLDSYNKKLTKDKVEFQINLYDLSRAQLKLTKVIFLLSQETATKTTPPVEIEFLSKYANLPIPTIKKTLQRLEIKGFLKRVAFKNGRGGWSQYNLCTSLEKQLTALSIKDKLDTAKSLSEDSFSLFRKASLFSGKNLHGRNIGTTQETNKEPETRNFSIKKLPRPWCYLNTDMLKLAGLTNKQLYYLFYQGTLTAAQIQASVDFFLGELVSENKNKNNYLIKWLNFINALLNGSPYAPKKNYDLPKNFNFKIFSDKKQENDFNKDLTAREITDFLLEEWVNSLHFEERNKLFAEKNSLHDSKQQREFLRTCFLKMNEVI